MFKLPVLEQTSFALITYAFGFAHEEVDLI